MNIFVITDTHFGHDAMIKYCGRPKNHSELILLNLRRQLQKGDMLIHLGDICIGQDSSWHTLLMNELSGVKKILVKGNHDKKSNNWYLDHGWDFVCNFFGFKFLNKEILFTHSPSNTKIGHVNIHGHFHNNLHRMDMVITGYLKLKQTSIDLYY